MRVLLIVALIGWTATANADTYSTFQTTRYYSANRQYIVELKPNKRALVYRRGHRFQLLWSRILPHLPANLFITNDGSRVVLIDHYYGNDSSPSANAILFFDQRGNQFSSYKLAEIANLPRVVSTTSTAHWYYGAFFTRDQSGFAIETIVRKCDPPTLNARSREESKQIEDCLAPQPYEELLFSVATGRLISRAEIQNRYTDPEKRLLHELELAENAHPHSNLTLAPALLRLASFYGLQKEYGKAAPFYEKAIPMLSKAFGADSSVAEAVGDAATNHRELGNYRRAEHFYATALRSLDKKQGDPSKVPPIAIKVYEEYAVLLRKLQRDTEAQQMESRARVLRSANPDYEGE